MWCRIALAGYKVAYFKDPQNCYRVHSKNSTKSYIRANEYHFGIFKGIEKVFDAIPAQSDLQKLRPIAVNEWIVGSIIKHLFFSLIRGKRTDVKKDIDLLTKSVRWAGMFRMIPSLSILLLKLIKRFRKRLSVE